MRYALKPTRPGFTWLELVVVIVVLVILAAMFLPSVRTAREAARRMACSNNLKQIGLAIHNYEAATKHLPSAMAGTGSGATALAGNANRLSGLVALLPYLEQNELWKQISAPLAVGGVEYPAMGPAPWIEDYPPWQSRLPVLLCPSWSESDSPKAPTNYAFCIGDITQDIHDPQAQRGAFACRMVPKLSSLTDGTSNTIAVGEIGNAHDRLVIGQAAVDQPAAMLTSPLDCLLLRDPNNRSQYSRNIPLSLHGRGARWVDGAAPFGVFATILPPNSPNCAVGGTEAVDGIYSSGSLHTGGTQVAFADGSVHFISETIDVGDTKHAPPTAAQYSSAATPSPYGVWGALGTAAGGEASTPD